MLPLLRYDIIKGYLIYDSSETATELPLAIDSDKVVYIPFMPADGITAALNKSQKLAMELFPSSTHYTYFHSADLCIASPEIIAELAFAVSQLNSFDLAFFAGINRYKNRDETLLPRYHRILSGMTVTHMGAIISHRLHTSLDGYSRIYNYAMDYDFFLRAFFKRCKSYSSDLPFAIVSTEGISSNHPYLALRDCARSRWRISAQRPLLMPLLFLFTFISFAKRLAFDFFSILSPNFLVKLRILLSRGRLSIHSKEVIPPIEETI